MQQPKQKHGLKRDPTPCADALWETASAKELATALLLMMQRFGNTRQALRDLLAFYDRRTAEGWTAADVERLRQIREVASK